MDELDDLLDPDVKEGSGSVGSSKLPNANAILTLGIISIVGCFLYGIPGLICGIIALSLYSKDKKIYLSNPSKYEQSHKNAKAGFICAIIGTSLSAIYFVVAIVMIFAIIGGMRL